MADAPRKALGVSEEVARQRLMESPETREIAQNLGMDLAEYVQMVIDYAKHPEKEPMLEVLDDETLESLGAEVPSQGEVMAWLEAVKRGEIDLTAQAEQVSDEVELQSAEEDRKKRLSAALGSEASKAAPKVGDLAKPSEPLAGPAGSVLKQQLLAQRTVSHQKIAAKAQITQPKPKGGR